MGYKAGSLDKKAKKMHDDFFIKPDKTSEPEDGPLTAPEIDPDEVLPNPDEEDHKDVPDIQTGINWDEFKSDVGLKHMILEIDIAILMRNAILHVDDPELQARLDKIRHFCE